MVINSSHTLTFRSSFSLLNKTCLGTARVLALSHSVLQAAKKYSPETAIFNEVKKVFVGSGTILGTLDIVGRIAWFVTGTRKGWEHTASMICFAARQLIGGGRLISEKLNIVIPHFEVAMVALRIGGYSFYLGYHLKESFKVGRELDRQKKALEALQEDLIAIDRLALYSDRGLKSVNPSASSPVVSLLMQRAIREDIQFKGDSYKDLHSLLAKKYQERIQDLTKTVKKLSVEKRDHKIAVAHAINNIALGVITGIGLAIGTTLFLQASWLLIGLSILVNCYGLYKFIITKCCKATG